MARPLMSPEDMQIRRDTAVFLLEGGATSVRAVAEFVKAHPSSVHGWKKAQEADGIAAEVVFDRHRTKGAAWNEGDALEKQAKRAARRAQKEAATNAAPIVDTIDVVVDALEIGPPRFKRNRARRMGDRLREKLGLPDLDRPFSTSAPALDEHAERAAWAVPALRMRVAGLLMHDALSLGRGGLTTAQLRARLGAAFQESDEDDGDFNEQFDEALRRFGFARASDGRWQIPRAR